MSNDATEASSERHSPQQGVAHLVFVRYRDFTLLLIGAAFTLLGTLISQIGAQQSAETQASREDRRVAQREATELLTHAFAISAEVEHRAARVLDAVEVAPDSVFEARIAEFETAVEAENTARPVLSAQLTASFDSLTAAVALPAPGTREIDLRAFRAVRASQVSFQRQKEADAKVTPAQWARTPKPVREFYDGMQARLADYQRRIHEQVATMRNDEDRIRESSARLHAQLLMAVRNDRFNLTPVERRELDERVERQKSPWREALYVAGIMPLTWSFVLMSLGWALVAMTAARWAGFGRVGTRWWMVGGVILGPIILIGILFARWRRVAEALKI